jgi:hypothetical protein
MRIFRPLFFGLPCGGAFGFPETGRFLLFGRGFLPWGGGAFFGLGGGGAFLALGGGGGAFFGLGGGGAFLALGGGGGPFFPFGGGGGGGGGGGLSAMLTPHANTESL